jgi:chromosome segregation ATPase
MKGFYILLFLLSLFLVLGYLVMKPTDSDLRRTYERMEGAMRVLKKDLAELQAPLRELQNLKRRTSKLERENDHYRQKVSELTSKMNMAMHNLDNLTEKIREATASTLADLEKEINQTLVALGSFSGRVKTIHGFIKESYPLLAKMENLQKRLNQKVDEREKAGQPYSEERLKDIEGYNLRCRDLNNQYTQAFKAIHSNFDQGRTMAQILINELNNLLPTFEAFLEDLEKSK